MRAKGAGWIIFLAVFAILSTTEIYAQEVTVKGDSAGIGKQNQNIEQNRNQNQEKNSGQKQGKVMEQKGEMVKNQLKNQGSAGQQGPQGAVKQVKGARPDMSKARGARPPDIVRPSGSGIPKGIGRPGGAFRRGGR
jgi:hypothetical protein